ncbi:MAG TPA: hypothetical protein VFZ47_05670 [Chitinophagaceae bacterium]
MKNASFLILLLLSLGAAAQSVFTNQTNSAIEKVIRDFPNQFRNIKGTVLLENHQSVNYQSNIQIPGAISCMVTQHHSNKESLSWKAELFQFENFHEAKNKYQDLFGQIRNTIVKIEGEKPYILNGQYEIPAEQRRSQSVVFNMLPSVGGMQNVKVELMLIREGSAWKISLAIYDDNSIGQLVSGD